MIRGKKESNLDMHFLDTKLKEKPKLCPDDVNSGMVRTMTYGLDAIHISFSKGSASISFLVSRRRLTSKYIASREMVYHDDKFQS